MKKDRYIIHQIIFISVSFLFWFYLLGPKFISPLNQNWLYNGDLPIYQIGWNFFRNDIWRFPFGLNPNYGIYSGGSVVFSDSIPLLAFTFKIFKKLIPETFQYFSLWILLCVYLQIFLAYKIIFHYSENFFYSLISSFFFLTSTIFIFRSGIHLSLMGHWLILLYYYINISAKINFKENKKKILILFSSLIHFYFTIILIIIYFLEAILNLRFTKNNVVKFFLSNLIFFIFLILLMYIVGYFSINLDDSLGGGYGFFSFNLNSFFNPQGVNTISSFSWSFFLNEINFYNGNIEGFSYLGLSGFFFIILYFFNLITDKYEIIFKRKISIVIFMTLILLAASNNINLGEYNLLNIKLNKYFYLLLSSVRASGRLIWPVFYLIFFCGILYIYFSQSKKRANTIILFLFIIQLIDLTPGLLNYKFGKQFKENTEQFVKNENWSGLSQKFSELRLLSPENQSELFYKFAKHILSEDYHKTDVSYSARVSRESLEAIREDQIKKFNNKEIKIFNDRVYITQNISLVNNLKILYGNKLKYYLMDNVWIISSSTIEKLSKYSYTNSLFEFFKLDGSDKILQNFKYNENNPFGFGWEYDKKEKKYLSVGNHSTLIFKLKKSFCDQNINLKVDFKKYFNNDNNFKEIKVMINDEIYENILINHKSNFNVKLSNNCLKNDLVKIDLFYIDPVSKYKLKSGLNRKKRAIIINSIHVTEL